MLSRCDGGEEMRKPYLAPPQKITSFLRTRATDLLNALGHASRKQHRIALIRLRFRLNQNDDRLCTGYATNRDVPFYKEVNNTEILCSPITHNCMCCKWLFRTHAGFTR